MGECIGFKFKPRHRSIHISAEHDRTFQYSRRTGWCCCGGLWRIKLLWLNSVAASHSRCRCSLNWETDGGLLTRLMNMSMGSSLTDSCQKSEGLGQQGREMRLYVWLYGPFSQLAFFQCSREETANPSLTSESAIFRQYRHFLCHISSEHLFLYRVFLQTSIVIHAVQRVTFFRYLLWVLMPHFHGNKGQLSVFVFRNNAVLHCCVGLYHNFMNSYL